MDYIKYETTLKASGREYSKIVFWNRFIRNPIELILTWLPAAITIVCIALGCFSSYLAVIYAACWCYPIYIFGFHVRSFFLFSLLFLFPLHLTMTRKILQAFPTIGLMQNKNRSTIK